MALRPILLLLSFSIVFSMLPPKLDYQPLGHPGHPSSTRLLFKPSNQHVLAPQVQARHLISMKTSNPRVLPDNTRPLSTPVDFPLRPHPDLALVPQLASHPLVLSLLRQYLVGTRLLQQPLQGLPPPVQVDTHPRRRGISSLHLVLAAILPLPPVPGLPRLQLVSSPLRTVVL